MIRVQSRPCGLSSLLLAVWFAFAGITRAEPMPDAPAGSFGVVVIPDTQHYRGRGTKADPDSRAEVTNEVFDAYTKWIADNIRRQRIVFVSHVGDIVDKNTPAQWAVARRAMDRLHGRVPYGIAPGNHDMTGSGNSSLLQKYFPRSRFERFDWYGGTFKGKPGNPSISGNNANSYQLFSAAGLDFVVLHLECNAPDDVLDWAGGVLEKYADRPAIITTHMYLGPRDKPKNSRDYYAAPKGVMTWTKRHGNRGNSGQQMWDKRLSKHKNLFMICAGDQSRTQAMRMTQTGQHGNPVHSVLSDYGAEGLRVYNFQPSENSIRVSTYNPMKNRLCDGTKIVPNRGEHQFTLRYEMSP